MRERTLRASLAVLALPVLAALLPQAALAATHTSSILVSAIVEPGCQVAPAAATPGNWSAPVNVNCTLPVPYQVDVASGARSQVASLDPNNPAIAGISAYEQERALASLESPNQPGQAASSSDRVQPASSAADAVETSDRAADSAATVTITIVY